MKTVEAYAPGTIANLGAGFDILGAAVTGRGDCVRATLAEAAGVRIAEAGAQDLPSEAGRNTAGIAASEVLRRAARSGTGVTLAVRKGLPLSGGQGGSAASAAAAAVAVNELLGRPLDVSALLEAALVAEEAVAGRHLDNLAPALLGGIVLVRSVDPIDVVRLAAPPELRFVLAEPEQELRTKEARALLPASVPRQVAVSQAAAAAAFVAALAARDFPLLGRSLVDHIAEPVRAPLLPGFREAMAAARAAGALGGSISGSGPAAFAVAISDGIARRVAAAMEAAYGKAGVTCRARVAAIDTDGARIVASRED